MASGDPSSPEALHGGWKRSSWLAEKIRSGELPAPESAMLRECDAIFVAAGGTDEHVRRLAHTLTGVPEEAPAVRARRLDGLRAYLDRLLLLHEMWSRERS